MPLLERPGVRLNYEVWEPAVAPEGRVTLVNGFTRTLADVRMMGRHLTDHGFLVAAVDNRGAGKTETDAPFTVEDMAGDLPALWDALRWETSDLVGISQGGMISLTLALDERFSSRIRRLVLISTAPSRSYVAMSEWERDPARFEEGLLQHFSPEFAKNQKYLLQAFLKEMAKAFQDPARAERAKEQRAAMTGFDVAERISEIRVPTLVLHGELDRIIAPAAAEAMANAIPGAKLILHKSAGHLLLAEAPRFLYEKTIAFLEE